MTVSDPLRRHAGPAARYRWLVLGLALVAAAWKLDVAATTAGTNDVIHWAQFGAGVRRVGPIDVYSLRFPIVYNHPPLIGWMLVLMTWLADHGLPFRFTVRVPAVAADVLTSLLVFEIIRVRRSLQEATAAGILVGCSPVLFVISGFHGNTDPVFVCLAVLSACLLVDRRLPVAAGLCLGAALSVKLVPIVAAPALLVGAARQGRLRRFVGGTAVIFLLVWTGPVLYQWHAFRRDVLGYAGFDPFRQWGLTRLAVWARASPHVIELWRGPGRFLVLLVCAAVPALLAWRRLADTPLAVGSSLAIFLLLSPTFATQYLVWPVAGLALLGFFGGAAYNLLAGALVVATYNRWAGGFPWNLALARKLDAGEVRLAAVVWLALLLAVVVGGVRSLRRPPDWADRKGGAPGRARRRWRSRPCRTGKRPGEGARGMVGSAGPARRSPDGGSPSVDLRRSPSTCSCKGEGSSMQEEPARRARIGVLVVAYNAEPTLEATLDRIPPSFRDRIDELIVCDDASHDDTFLHGQRWARRADTPRCLVVRHTKNLGYGGNQKAGYDLAIERGLDVVVLLHGDGQYAPELLPQMVAPLERGECDAVFGSRMLSRGAARRGGMPMYKRAGNRILTWLENGLLGSNLSEFHSGYRAYSTRALREVPYRQNSDGFDFDTQIIIQLLDAGKRIVEIPIPTYYGDEICYVNGLRYACDVVRDVVRYRFASRGFGTYDWVPKPREYAFKYGDESSHTVILDMLAALPPSEVLDLGCSTGLLAAHARAAGHHVTGVDRQEHPLVRDRTDVFARADLEHGIPAEVGSGFDVVVAGDVIEHLADPRRALGEIRRVLRPGGQVLLSVPNVGHWYPRARAAMGIFGYDRRGILDETHLRFFTRTTLRRLVTTAGFDVLEERWTGLPLGTISEADGRKRRVARWIDGRLVMLRPTLFGYQQVLRLTPHVADTVVVAVV